ncbi:MAG: hypothetical protein OXT68_07620 [Chloroflexota bacterium]|nr:hypothetical protein [Chloroflexota bacterium]
MLGLIYPMGMVLLSWLLLFLLFSGLGVVALRLLGHRLAVGIAWFDSFWLGWALALAALQLWHLLFAVDDRALILLAIVAAVGLYQHRQRFIPQLLRLKKHRAFLLMLLIALLWMSNRALEMPDEFDTGFRDIQAVMWMDAYPIVPGLNNLFSSLAYNHSVYLYQALLDTSIWSGRSYHIATGLLLTVMLAYSLHSAVNLYQCRAEERARWSWIFATLVMPFFLFSAVGRGSISHFLTDATVDLLGILVLIWLLDFLQDAGADAKTVSWQVLRLSIVILAGFTIKQTFWVFGVGIAGLVIVALVLRAGGLTNLGRLVRLSWPVLLIAVLFAGPWMLRGVVTSGYIAYPHAIGRIEVDWAEPPDLIEHRQRQLATNTRRRYGDPEIVLATWDWVGPWFDGIRRNVKDFALPAALTMSGLFLYASGRVRRRAGESRGGLGLWVFAPLLIMLAFWFVSLPNLKYVRYIFWSGAVLSWLLAMLSWTRISWRLRVSITYAVLGICLAYFMYLLLAQRDFAVSAGPGDGFYQHPLPPVKVYETASGLQLNVPDSHIHQCWQIPLPCTPFPRKGIFARVPGQLQHGFGFNADDGLEIPDD